MIKINLLGKKKQVGALPFGLDERLEKLGVKADDLAELRPGLVRLGLLLTGLYIGNYVPNYIHQMKIEALDAQIATLNSKTSALKRELTAKQDIRKQMDQLNKDEYELQRRLSAVSAITKDRDIGFRTVDYMVASLPQKVWFKKLTYEDKKVNLEGGCWEYFPITDFVRAINESTRYTAVTFKDIKSEAASQTPIPGVPIAAQRVKNFELSFSVKGAGDS